LETVMGDMAPRMRRSPSSRGLLFLAVAALVLALGCSGKVDQAGGLEIIVYTDMPTPARFDTLQVDIQRQSADGGWTPALLAEDGGTPLPSPQSYAIPGQIVLPTRISVTAGSSADLGVLITVAGLKGGAAGTLVVRRTLQTNVPSTSVGEVYVDLDCPSCPPPSDACTCGTMAATVATPTPYAPGDGDDAGVPSSLASVVGTGMNEAGGDATLAEGGADSATVDTGGSDTTGIVPPYDAGDAGPGGGTDGPTCVDVCTAGQARCAAASTGVETCQVQSNGCTLWATTATCGVHQSCQAMGDTAACACSASSCSQAGQLCQSTQTLVTCAKDADGCSYAAASSTCPAATSCSGMAPGAMCSSTCTDSCIQGQTSCVPGGLASCTVAGNGCLAYGAPAACGTHQSCTGTAGAQACTCNVDPLCAPAIACASATTLAVCTKDAQDCTYSNGSSACANGACSAGACCVNACTNGAVRCGGNAVQACNTQANGCAAWSSAACTGAVCERAAGPVCADPNWAEWPMPNGQTDVTAGAPNLETYTNNGDGTVTDNVTGLIWQQAVPAGTFAQGGAATYCASLNLGGFQDWRLPTFIELFSLVDLSVNPTIDATYFPGTGGVIFWSSTPTHGTPGSVWIVKFSVGLWTTAYPTTGVGYVRCVR
jgi:hypothetical protein